MNPSLWSLSSGAVLSHLSVLLAPLTAVLNLDLLLYLSHQQPWYLNAVAKSGVNCCSAGVEMACLLWRKNMEKLQKREGEAVKIPASGKTNQGFSSLTNCGGGKRQLKTAIQCSG